MKLHDFDAAAAVETGLKPALRDALTAAQRPIESARGLPNAFYTDPDLAQLERQALFFDGWAGLAFAHDAPNPGDVYPLDFHGAPLLLARDQAGALRVFHNVCRHRGMILVEEKKNIPGALRCPYHSWCYKLSGELVSTPHVGGPGQNLHADVDRNELGLVEAPSAVWMGVVFVNLSGTAPAFEEAHAAVRSRWAEHQQPRFFGGPDSTFTLTADTNWKLAVENYCESYHLPWVHPGLNSYSRLEDHYDIAEPGAFSGQGTTVYNPKLDDSGRAFANFDGLSDSWDTGAEYISFFPNVLFGAHRDHTYAILLEPDGVNRTRERVAIFYASETDAGPEMADLREKNTALWRGIFEEDIFVVEGMQKGRSAPGFDGGKFSPVMDGPTHIFHAWAADRLAARLG